MLVKSNYFNGMNACALDGRAGKVTGLLLDTKSWKVRYLVIQNRTLTDRKKFIISTFSVSSINYETNTLKLDITLSSMEEEPFLEKAEGVGIQVKHHFFDLSGWPYHDKMFHVGWLTGPFGVLWQTRGVEHNKKGTSMHLQTNALMNAFQLIGMSISCRDRDFGVLKNLMIDPHSWECRFIEIRKVKWLPSDSTVIPVQLIKNLNLKKRLVDVDTHEKKILEAPYYNPRIFSSLSEKLFLQYFNVYEQHSHFDDSKIDRSIA